MRIVKRVIVIVPPFTRAFLKSPSSRGLSAVAELVVLLSFVVYVSYKRIAAMLRCVQSGLIALTSTWYFHPRSCLYGLRQLCVDEYSNVYVQKNIIYTLYRATLC